MKSTSLVLLALIIGGSLILSYSVRSPWVFGVASMHKQTPRTLMQLLEDLKAEINALPEDAFKNPRIAEQRKKSVCNDINAVTNQVEAGAYTGSINKLENAFRNKMEKWIVDPWKNDLIEKVNYIIDVFGHYV